MMAKRISLIFYACTLFVLLQTCLQAQFSVIDSIFTKTRTYKIWNGSDSVLVTDTIIDDSRIDVINTNAIDVITKKGKIQLSTGLQTNLAKGTSAIIYFMGVANQDSAQRNPLKLLDGDVSSNSDVVFSGSASKGIAGSYFIVDLNAIRSVNQIRLCTYIPNNRIRSYTIYGGLDTVSMEKLYVEKEDTIFSSAKGYSELNFTATNVRYLKFRVDDLITSDMVLSDFQVFGPGFLPEGMMYSTVRTINKNVNFSTIRYEGSIPNLTRVYFSFRTGKNAAIDTTWGIWSDEVTGNDNLIDVQEPRRFIQYRVHLYTDTLNTPVIEKIIINYDTELLVSETKCSINPQQATVLKERDFTLRTVLTFKPTDIGFDTLLFTTPSPVILKSVLFNGAAIPYQAKTSFKEVQLTFPTTVKTSGNLDIIFRTTPFVDAKPHTMRISSNKIPNNPQRVDSDTKDGIDGWSIILVGVPSKLLNGVKLTRNPFTPNGDGKNDYTEIEFFLGNIAEPKSFIGTELRNLSVKIHDLTGRNIRTVFDAPTNASAFKGEGNPMIWDGRDDYGKIVRPGIYLIQIVIDADSGAEQVTKTVVVAY